MRQAPAPALATYRGLPPSERATYDPPRGMRGAPAVRELQEIARYIRRTRAQRPAVRPARLDRMRAAAEAETRDLALIEIPLGDGDREAVTAAVRAANPRLKNWDRASATVDRAVNRRYATIDHGRYSYRCDYRHLTYEPALLSAGRIADDGTVLGAVIDEGQYTLVAPRGYRWGADANGIRLYRTSRPADDFHPTSDDIRAGIAHIVGRLRANAETRRQAKLDARRTAAVERPACAHGVWVCVADSAAAGNCAAGTSTYCDRHQLDRSRHYRAEVLRGRESTPLVEAAIAAATKRQIADWQRGYSAIA